MKTFLLSSLTVLLCSASFSQEVVLEDIMFSDNWFSDLEEAKKTPNTVFYLDLSMQKLKEFPSEILEFKNLKRLLVPVNYWPSIPDEISTLRDLQIIDLSSNYYLNQLPQGLEKLPRLERIVLKDNRLNKGEIERIQKLLPNCEIITN